MKCPGHFHRPLYRRRNFPRPVKIHSCDSERSAQWHTTHPQAEGSQPQGTSMTLNIMRTAPSSCCPSSRKCRNWYWLLLEKMFGVCDQLDSIPSIDADGATARGWDIWNGGTTQERIPRAEADTVETLLGKVGTVTDRHSNAAKAILDRLISARQSVVCRHCSWDEAAMVYQLKVRGFLGYAPPCNVSTRRGCGLSKAGSGAPWHPMHCRTS